jgi:DNA-binding SARP family transcriptional activator
MQGGSGQPGERAGTPFAVPSPSSGSTRAVGISFGVLGRLEVRRAGELLGPLPPQQRHVLCLLVLRAGTVVPDEVFTRALWDRPPDGPFRQRLFQLVSKVRDALGPDRAESAIHRSSGGYQLSVAADDIDAAHFERLRAGGMGRCLTRPAQALRDLRAADGLWRGPPYHDVDDRPEFADEIRRLDELRRSCREYRLEAMIAVGRHQDAVDELAALVVGEGVLRERTQLLYVHALYLSGRKVEACRHYEQLWDELRGERLEPGPELKDLYDRIVADDATLTAPSPARGRGMVPVTPFPAGAHLALDGPAFVGADGRAELLPHQAFLQALAPVLDVAPGEDPRAVLDRLAGRRGLFDEIVALAAAVTSSTDVALFIDDLQWVGDDGLALWLHLLRSQPLGLTLIATLRASPGGDEPGWLTDLRDRGRVTVADLAGLGPTAVTELARQLGRELSPEDAGTLVARTAGNPFFVMSVLTDGSAPHGTGEVASSVLAGFHRLPAASRRLLEAGALVGRSFDPGPVSRAIEAGDPDGALAPALDAGILRRAEPGRATVVFGHDIVRDAILGELDRSRRRDLHRRLGEAGEAADPDALGSAAELADHFLAAADGDLDRVVRYSLTAGDEARAASAHSVAAHHYRRALDAAALARPDGGRDRCILLNRLGDAEYAAYRITPARLAFIEAADLALRLGAGDELDEAVTALVWLHEFGEAQPDALDLLDRAARLMEDRTPARRALRALARARLGGVTADDADQLLDEAEALARSLPDERLLGRVLATACLVRWRPETLAWRQATAREVEVVGTRTASVELVLQSLRLHASASTEAGDIGGARDDFRRFVDLSAGSGRPAFDAGVAQIQNSFDLLHGRFAAVEDRLPRLLDGVSDSANFAAAYVAQLHQLRREQGRVAETLPLVRALAGDERFPGLRVAAGLAELEAGNAAAAGAALDAATAGGLDGFPRDWLWMATMAELAEAAAVLRRPALAAQVHERLEPFAGQLVSLASGVLCLGSAHRFAGLAAVTAGRHDEGVAHLQAAVGIDEGIGAGPALARDHLALGRALAPHTPGPGDAIGARAALVEAARRADHLGMAGVAAAARRELDRL